jgi:small GTP-binding protein
MYSLYKYIDTAGMERYKSLGKTFYKSAHVCVIVYDICSYESFKNVDNWKREFEEQNKNNATILILGNKKDLNDKRAVMRVQFDKMKEKYGCQCFEVAANSNDEQMMQARETIIDEVRKLDAEKDQEMENILEEKKKDKQVETCTC